jgi:hypothetical protein
MALTQTKQEAVKAHINRAIVALVDAQLELLAENKVPLYAWNIKAELGESFPAYYLLNTAENTVLDAFRALTKVGE